MANEANIESFFDDLGGEVLKAHEEARKREPVLDSGGIVPAGIENGVAELRDLRIGIYQEGENKNKPFFSGYGVILAPKYVQVKGDTVYVQGRLTKINPEPLCHTPEAQGKRKTFLDHWLFMEDTLKNLGLKDYLENLITNDKNQLLAGIKAGMLLLVKQKPKFHFRTWSMPDQLITKRDGRFYCTQGRKTLGGPYSTEEQLKVKHPYAGQPSLVFHVWQGLATEWKEEKPSKLSPPSFRDETGGPPSADYNTPNTATDNDVDKGREYSQDNANQADFMVGGQLDLAAVVKAAEAGDDHAIDILEERARAVGRTEHEIKEAPNYQAVADMAPLSNNESTHEAGKSEESSPSMEDEDIPF